MVWAFELVVINGVFLTSTLKSLFLAAIHPLFVALTVSAYNHAHVYSIGLGLLMVASAVIFLLKLKQIKTKNGISSLGLLQAFLDTWVEHEPHELEKYFLMYAKTESVQTEVIVAKTGARELSIIIPGVHSGPFAPVGSYNLSELIYGALHSDNTLPIVLHGIGGHERNVPTNELASKHVQLLEQFAGSLDVTTQGRMKGPLRSRVGAANITTMLFGNDAIAIISTAPFVSDDLNPETITDATIAASELGLQLSIVDAHNSIGGQSGNPVTTTKEDWQLILKNTEALSDSSLRIGFAHSSEIDFRHGLDISQGGMCVILLSNADSKNILVTADSNNAVLGLREKIAEAVEGMGFRFLELCTSDTHAFAARNLTDRGYFALGEDTRIDDIIAVISTLARKAEASVAPCTIEVAKFRTEIPLIGHDSLDDFAALTSNAVSLSKNYAKIVVPVAMLLMVITLFY